MINRCECQEEALQLRQRQVAYLIGLSYGIKLFSISRTHFSAVSVFRLDTKAISAAYLRIATRSLYPMAYKLESLLRIELSTWVSYAAHIVRLGESRIPFRLVRSWSISSNPR